MTDVSLPTLELLGPARTPAVDAALSRWESVGFGRRLWAKDPTLWFPQPTPEITDRLGWLDLPRTMAGEAAEIEAWAKTVPAAGDRHLVVLGMGGSSLAPWVFGETFPSRDDRPELIVLDSTHPTAVRSVRDRLDVRRTTFLVSSKSGSTTEPNVLCDYFEAAVSAAGVADADRGKRFVAITDPGSPLESRGHSEGFAHVFRADPDVGGRYSALTHFGLVPFAGIGGDVGRLLSRAASMAAACGPTVPAAANPGLLLGAVLGELALAGRDKVTFLADGPGRFFPAWAEQLLAESTGKDGRGLIPVTGEPAHPSAFYGDDRLVVHLHGPKPDALSENIDRLASAGVPVVRVRLADPYDLGAEFFRWEVAVAAAGERLGIHPFNQPDVQLAKDLTREAIASPASAVSDIPSEGPTGGPALSAWLSAAHPGEYVVLQAYVDPTDEATEALGELREVLGDALRLPVTAQVGPRFLHSTGQLHKGGPPTGRFLQLVDDASPDEPIPRATFTFGRLIRAQATGDARALLKRGRAITRISLGGAPVDSIERLSRTIQSAGAGRAATV